MTSRDDEPDELDELDGELDEDEDELDEDELDGADRPAEVEASAGERLQKVLARAGVASRRVSEELITQGRVQVDGRIVRVLGTRVRPGSSIHVDGLRIRTDPTLLYLAFNKPVGVVSTMNDDQGRPALAEFLPSGAKGLFHVGRLDVDTEGLILVMNDGDLGHRLAHPSYEIPKTYLAEVNGPVPKDLGRRLKAGVELEDGLATVDRFAVVDSAPGRALLQVVVHEGRNRLVRRLLEAAGHPVRRLVRTDFGEISLGQLRPGRTRALTRDEIGRLHRSVKL
jgi:23S rRNA pseudouridine2605 synthase